jgi:Flp pilus assembly protein TadG
MEQNRVMRGRRGKGDEGAAIVEMAMVGIVLVLLLMGIMVFGYLMAFRQNLVQAATEGARAGAVAATGRSGVDATAAAQQAVAGFGKTCGSSGLSCLVTVGACPNAPAISCVTVSLTYDYEHNPLLPDVPIVAGALPQTIQAKAVAEVNA